MEDQKGIDQGIDKRRALELEVSLAVIDFSTWGKTMIWVMMASCSLQVLRLETKLRDLHATDSIADRRALSTLRQHVMALKQETQVLKLFCSLVGL